MLALKSSGSRSWSQGQVENKPRMHRTCTFVRSCIRLITSRGAGHNALLLARGKWCRVLEKFFKHILQRIFGGRPQVVQPGEHAVRARSASVLMLARNDGVNSRDICEFLPGVQIAYLAEEAARARSANVLMLEQLQEAPARSRERADGGNAEPDLQHVSGPAAWPCHWAAASLPRVQSCCSRLREVAAVPLTPS